MTDSVVGAPEIDERRAGSAGIGEKLVAERAAMLVRFCQAAGLEPYHKETDQKIVQQRLQEFCQVLMDYVATGHFGLYERITAGKERRQGVAELADELYPRIAETTELAVAFNDKYDCGDNCDVGDNLDKDLSILGEELAVRAELEDRLLTAMVR
ncbi:MAG: Rsd/AlgQ family anti-sigma factor [Acidiferrobacterales bacterium]